jgi:pimeloyl-ACP methyl ester carboxylesterase
MAARNCLWYDRIAIFCAYYADDLFYWELTGQAGDPLVLVHGSWGDHHTWDQIVPLLACSFRVLTYDRRGHSQSERPAGQGSIREDVADLAALIEHLDLAPAHILGNSFGGTIVLGLAVQRPELFRSMLIHEPPFFGLSEDPAAANPPEIIAAAVEKLEAGQLEAGTRLFMEAIVGADVWQQTPEELRQAIVSNAPTFLDEVRDREWQEWSAVELERLATFSAPMLLTKGEQSPPIILFTANKVERALPQAQTQTLKEAGHVPQITHPEQYAEVVEAFIKAAVPSRA